MADEQKLTGETITLGGKTWLVTAEMAKALKEREAAWEDEKKKLSTPPPVPNVAPKTVSTPGQSVDEDFDPDDILIKPKEVLNRFGQKITDQILTALEEKEVKKAKEQAAQQQRDQFWQEFAAKHPDLKNDVSLARTVLYDNSAQFERFQDKSDDQSKNECIDLLADLTRKEIQKYIARTKEETQETKPADHPFVEGAVLKFGNQAPPPKPGEQPSSLTETIKKRAEARRKGKVA